MNHKVTVVYDDIYLNWRLGAGDGSHPTNPVRAKLATELLQARLGDELELLSPNSIDRNEVVAALKSIHEPRYVDNTLAGNSSEWYSTSTEVADAGLAMFAGTMVATRKILSGETKVAFNPQGAKHHAQKSHSSGFCVFNDMVWAALEFQRAGLKPLYLDWDIHAGDGVYHMLKGTGIATISIHNGSIYPFDSEMQAGGGERATHHNPVGDAFNFNVAMGDGDDAFKWAIDGAAEIIEQYQPDVILLAAGADGHKGVSKLGQCNNYTDEGFGYAAKRIADLANKHADGRVLIGGAGGYQPLKETPETWALVVETIFRTVEAGKTSAEKQSAGSEQEQEAA